MEGTLLVRPVLSTGASLTSIVLASSNGAGEFPATAAF